MRRAAGTRRIELNEWAESEPLRLSVAERDALTGAVPSLSANSVIGERGVYRLKPQSVIGAIEIDDLSVMIRPKLDISRVIYLASYAMGAYRHRDERFDFETAPTLVEALALALTSAARRAFARGLLHGYRSEQDALRTVRGRIDMAEQLRRRLDGLVPVEVRYDDFTDDILPNRLTKAAVAVLGRMRLEDRRSRDGLRWMDATLANVSLVRFEPREVPEVVFDRLNEHYREVVSLSRLILRCQALEQTRGAERASGFLVDMNAVFQGFVTRALRDSLGVSESTLCSDDRHLPPVHLDTGGRLRLKPDLSWWDGRVCTFVGDAKYKRIDTKAVPNADLYQMLAYVTALNLPGGLLVYAKGETEPVDHVVRHANKRLEVAAVDLAGAIDDLHTAIDRLAERVRLLRAEATGDLLGGRLGDGLVLGA